MMRRSVRLVSEPEAVWVCEWLMEVRGQRDLREPLLVEIRSSRNGQVSS